LVRFGGWHPGGRGCLCGEPAMRLICPNCDAQYEVDASLVPESGRDVQCSDCGHVWFQVPESGLAAEQDEDADVAAVVWPDHAAQTPAPEAAAWRDPEPTEPPEPDDGPDPQILRRLALDESLLAVLREEADRETRARAEEAARNIGRGVEIQPELGLDDGGPGLRIRPRTTPAPEAPAPDADEAPTDSPPPDAGLAPGIRTARPARRELLPDIDRINSTLDASNATRKGGTAVRVPEPPERHRAGFQRGFVLALLIGAVGWGVYGYHAQLSAALPSAAPYIQGYVGAVDTARIGLDGLVKGLLDSLNG
jgi:predicted Zn finger-like uncharacterized protein